MNIIGFTSRWCPGHFSNGLLSKTTFIYIQFIQLTINQFFLHEKCEVILGRIYATIILWGKVDFTMSNEYWTFIALFPFCLLFNSNLIKCFIFFKVYFFLVLFFFRKVRNVNFGVKLLIKLLFLFSYLVWSW